MFESNDVVFSIVALRCMPPVAEALRNVLLNTNVPMRVTFVRMEPATVLFSSLLFTIVELVMFTPTVLTVFRDEWFTVDCVMFDEVIDESSMSDRFIIEFCRVVLSMLEFCT